MSTTPSILETRSLCKEFPGVRALSDVSLSLAPGEIHGLVGENGAGKSTLMNILSGVLQPTSGHLVYRGRDLRWQNVADAQHHGIAMIHQELNLIDELTVADNIFLGREKHFRGLVQATTQENDALDLLKRLNARISPKEIVKHLSVAEKQLVEIAKAVSCRAHILIMDEPTAVLTQRETEALFNLIRQLRKAGVTVVYISHILPEVLSICDRITVMRDGKIVRTLEPDEVKATNEKQLASMMVGRPMADHFPPRGQATPKVLLSLRGISSGSKVHDVSLNLCCGEIVGLAGLVGAGRTELAETIVGLRRCDSGVIELEGRELNIQTAADAIDEGIAYLSEDRKGCGLTLGMSTAENVVMVSLKRYTRGLISLRKQREQALEYVQELKIKVADVDLPVQNLSGGNQQKVAIAKWLETNPKVLILDEPTRGVDIGAKEEIYRLIKQLSSTGMGCLMISSEFNELLGMCHRIGVMREGRLVGVVEAESATEESLMHLAAGVNSH